MIDPKTHRWRRPKAGNQAAAEELEALVLTLEERVERHQRSYDEGMADLSCEYANSAWDHGYLSAEKQLLIEVRWAMEACQREIEDPLPPGQRRAQK